MRCAQYTKVITVKRKIGKKTRRNQNLRIEAQLGVQHHKGIRGETYP